MAESRCIVTLHDDIVASYERVKNKLKEAQGLGDLGRRTVSRDMMPFQYANGRVMFNATRTRELIREYAVQGSVNSVVSVIADAMRGIPELSALTVGYVRNDKMDYVFIFVHLQD